MDKERTIRGIEILVSSALFLIIIYALYLRFLPDEETFQQLVREDGFVEYTTVVFLLFMYNLHLAGILLPVCKE